MRAVQEDTDYRIFLTEEDIRYLSDRRPSNKGIDIFPGYKPLSSDFLDNKGEKATLRMAFTRDVLILNDEKTHDNIFVNFDKKGPLVKIYPPVLKPLLEGGYAVTRYNGESKIWLHMETD